MSSLLNRIYLRIVKKIIDKEQTLKSKKDQEAKDKYKAGLKKHGFKKFDHALYRNKLNRNEQEYEHRCKQKLAKWRWLKRLT